MRIPRTVYAVAKVQGSEQSADAQADVAGPRVRVGPDGVPYLLDEDVLAVAARIAKRDAEILRRLAR